MSDRVPALLMLIVAMVLAGEPAAAQEAVSRYAPFEGGNLHYLDAGAGERTLVFVHGWACDAAFWKEQIPAFRHRLRVLTIDLPGHGRSDSPDVDYTMDRMARGVLAAIEHAKAARVVLVAHSMGLAVARRMIRLSPRQPAGLVIIDGAYVSDPYDDPQGYQESREFALRLAEDLRTPRRAEAVAEFLAPMYGPKTSDSLRAWIASRVMDTEPRVAASAIEQFVDRHNWQGGVFEGPTLAIYAVSPELPPNNVDTLRNWFENLRYVEWPGVGHFPMLERPQLVNGLISAFLTDIGW